MRLRKPIITAIVALLSFSVLADSNPSETPELDRLKAKHDIENPERNFRELEGLDFSQSEDNDQRTEELLDEMFARGLQDGGQVDLSRYNQEINREQLQSNAASWALRSSSNVGMPSMNDDGNIKLEYSQEGTLKHVRNENGEYGFAASDGGARRTAGLAQEDLYTQEVNNEDHIRFDGVRDAYGDEDMLFKEGSTNLSQLRNHQNLTSDAVAYRTILDSQERALETEINESFLDGTVEFLDDIQNNPGQFFSECRVAQTTTTVGAEGNLSRDYTCTDVDRNNYDFCELRRELELKNIEYINYITCSGPALGQPYYIDGLPAYMCSGVSNPETPLGTMTFQSTIQQRVEAGLWEALGQQGGILGGFAYLEKQEREVLLYSVIDYPENCYSKAGGELPKSSEHNGSGLTCPESHTWQTGVFACNGNLISEKDSDSGHQRECLYRDPFNEFCPVHKMTLEAPGQQSNFDAYSTLFQYQTSKDYTCTFDGYEIIEEGSKGWAQSILDDLVPLFPGDTGNVTWRVNLEGYACEPFDGEDICITPYGEDVEICKSWYGWFGRHDDDLSEFPEGHPALNESCDDLRNNRNCERVDSSCAEGMLDGEVCRISDVQYKCATGVGGSREIITETNQCDAMIPCAGGECDNTETEINQDFNKAALQASVLHELNNDNSCFDSDEGCEIFTGTYSVCAKPKGGAKAVKLGGPNCCEDPTAIGVQEYIKAMRQVSQFETVQNTATWAAKPFKGGYDKISKGVETAWDKVTSPFTGSTNAANSSGAGAGGSGNMFTDGMGAIRDATMKWMANNLPESITHAVFATATEEVAGEVVTKLVDPPEFTEGLQAFGNFAQGLMTMYGYYTMLKLALDIVFACDAEESEAAGSIAQLQCVYLGRGACKMPGFPLVCERHEYEYCCFNSLLARIIMEQAVEQLERPFEQGDRPSCRGLTLDELAQLDWDLIDLESEWLPLMYESGLIAEDTSEHTLTGDGRTLNSGARQLVSERTKDRFRDISDDDVKDMDRELRTTLDCSKYPRPLICNYQ